MDYQNQAMIFLGSIYAGLSLGGFFDILRLVKLSLKSKVIGIILDVLFCLITFCVSFAALYVLSLLELRLYTLAGIAIGFCLYLAGVSTVIQWLIKKIPKKQKKD